MNSISGFLMQLEIPHFVRNDKVYCFWWKGSRGVSIRNLRKTRIVFRNAPASLPHTHIKMTSSRILQQPDIILYKKIYFVEE